MAEREKSVGNQASWSNLLNLNEHECQEANVLEHFLLYLVQVVHQLA